MSLIADCFDVSLIDDTGTIFATSTLSSADINITVESTEIRAGRGNALIAILHSGRQADITLAETTFKWDWLSKQFGTTPVVGATTAWAMSKWYTATDNAGTIEISLTPAPLSSGSGIKIYKVDGTEVTTGVVSGGKVTFSTGVTSGDKLEVRGYKYTTAATASTITIDNVSFADGVICVLETLEIDEDETKLSRVQYIFDEVLPSGNLTISTAKERDASITNVELKAIKPRTSDVIGRVVKIPIS